MRISTKPFFLKKLLSIVKNIIINETIILITNNIFWSFKKSYLYKILVVEKTKLYK